MNQGVAIDGVYFSRDNLVFRVAMCRSQHDAVCAKWSIEFLPQIVLESLSCHFLDYIWVAEERHA